MFRITRLAAVTLIAWATCAALGAHAAPRAVCYVSPSGDDAWSGHVPEPNADKTYGPFATLTRARDELRRLKADGRLPEGGAAVEILGGRYELGAPVELTAEDSGSEACPIVYRARPGAEVFISGSRLVKEWRPVTDEAILERLAPAARDKVVQLDLKAQGITAYGDLGVDAAAYLQYALAGADCQGEYTMGCVPPAEDAQTPECLELFFNDAPMPISRGPNEEAITIAEVLGATPRNVRGRIACVEGIFRYEGDYPKRWLDEKEVWLLGSWNRDWAEQRHRVIAHDPEERTITVAEPYHRYGYHKGQWFYGFNLLAELDQPGEWYLDHETGMLYFWPPSPIAEARTEVSMAPGLVTLTGVSHVTLRGLRFEGARGTAVTMKDCEQCRVTGCTLRNLGIHGVTVEGGKGNGVVGCDLYHLGGGGIYLIGGDRKTLTPAGHFAENNHIHHYARWNRMYRPAIVFSGVGQRASHNLIHDAPHAALIFGGNDHLIEFNEIHDVCCESNDCGAIYAGRDWTIRGTVIRHNYLHHLKGRKGLLCRGVYLDDLFSGAVVEGNVFYQATLAVFLGGGRDNLVENNIFVDCPKAMHVDGRALGWCGPHADGRIKEATEKGTIRGIRFMEPPFSTRYPKLLTLLDDDPKSPIGNVVRHNIFWPGDGEDLRRAEGGKEPPDAWWNHIEEKIAAFVKLEDNLVNVDPRFVDEKGQNFQLREESPAWALGFKRIPVEKIGLYADESRASWPVED